MANNAVYFKVYIQFGKSFIKYVLLEFQRTIFSDCDVTLESK